MSRNNYSEPSQYHLPRWNDRYWTTANMLNPALIGSTIATTATTYARESGDGLPWELTFLTVPMALHRDTREALPTRVSAHIDKWVTGHAALNSGLAGRMISMRPYVREGIRYAIRTGELSIANGGTLVSDFRPPSRRTTTPELELIIKRAGFLGRWFACAGSVATLYTLFGVAP